MKKMTCKRWICFWGTLLLILCVGAFLAVAADETTNDSNSSVAKVENTEYSLLVNAVNAANGIEGGATVTLLKDVTLGEKLTINGDVTISGEFTITRADSYTGTLFDVKAGATLTLDGGLVIDGGNEYKFDRDLYEQDLANYTTSIPATDSTKWFTPEEGAPVATAYMITTTGSLNLKNVSIKNHYSTNGNGIVSASRGAVVTLNGAQITHNASTSGSGLVVNASADVYSREKELITVVMHEGTVIDGNHVGGNHGIFKIYMGTYFTMNGGEIKNTTGWNSNGTVVGIYDGVFTMNNGTICSNSSVYGPSNGRNAAVYGHKNHLFTMYGGTICHNEGRSKGGVDSPYSEIGYTGQTFIHGGTIADNAIIGPWTAPDVSGGATLTITGGTFTQDVSQYIAPGSGLVYNEATKTYEADEKEFFCKVNGIEYPTLVDAVQAAQDNDIIELLCSQVMASPISTEKNVILDLKGYSLTVKLDSGEAPFAGNVRLQNGYVIGFDPADFKADGYDVKETVEKGKYYIEKCMVVTIQSGAGLSDQIKYVAKGELAEKPVDPIPAIPDYRHTFMGWYLDGKEYDFSTPVTRNITLVARWSDHRFSAACDEVCEDCSYVRKTATPHTFTDENDGWCDVCEAAREIRYITVQIADASKIYGEADPIFSWRITHGELAQGDVLSLTLVRKAGENAGAYAITAEGGHPFYRVTVEDGTLTILRREIGLVWENTTFEFNNRIHKPTAVATGLLEGDVCAVSVHAVGRHPGVHKARAVALSNPNYCLPEDTFCEYRIDADMDEITETVKQELNRIVCSIMDRVLKNLFSKFSF